MNPITCIVVKTTPIITTSIVNCHKLGKNANVYNLEAGLFLNAVNLVSCDITVKILVINMRNQLVRVKSNMKLKLFESLSIKTAEQTKRVKF